MKFDLTIRSPLKDLIRFCATYCEPACCGLRAFDVNAYVIFRWFSGTSKRVEADVFEQLDALVSQVAVHDGPIDSSDLIKHDFGHEWSNSAEFVAYLQTWRAEIVRALSFGQDVLKSPEPRLTEARLLGEHECYQEVRRLSADATEFLHQGDTAVALKILAAIAPLDAGAKPIASAVQYARKILTERGVSWHADESA